jgi:hypothetical protein
LGCAFAFLTAACLVRAIAAAAVSVDAEGGGQWGEEWLRFVFFARGTLRCPQWPSRAQRSPRRSGRGEMAERSGIFFSYFDFIIIILKMNWRNLFFQISF